MAISSSVDDPNRMDHLSTLPDDLLITILSLLPTRFAARTSLLSRRFRHLWEACPSLHFTVWDMPEPKPDSFIAMADRALLRRSPSFPLHSFHLELTSGLLIPSKHASFICSLLAKASALGVRRLTVSGGSFLNSHIIPIILSTGSLRSLWISWCYYPNALHYRGPGVPFESDVPFENTALNHLRFLRLGVCHVSPVKFEQFISKLSSLEELHLQVSSMSRLSISSKTIRKLELTFEDTQGIDNVTMSLPSLHFLDLFCFDSIRPSRQRLPHFHGNFPLLRKVDAFLFDLKAKDISAVMGLLNCISHVEELSLYMKETRYGKYPFPILLEPGKSTPNFLNLKHLDVTACFHRYNFEALVCILHHAPALESLELLHEVTWQGTGREDKDWGSNLPHNDEGDNCSAYFRNLHIGEKRDELMRLMTEKRTSKPMTILDLPY